MPDVYAEPIIDVGGQVESWLVHQTAASPETPILWMPHWSHHNAVSVRGVEHLTVLISMLTIKDYAGVESAHGESHPWGQTMNTPFGWIVEGHDGTMDDYASPFFRGDPNDHEICTGSPHHNGSEMWTPIGAAQVLWAWAHGTLLEGCSRTPQK